MNNDMVEKTPFVYGTTPFKHQDECFMLSRDMEYFALFMEMGTGKSKVLIDNAAYLFLNNKIDGLLIIAPKGAYLNWIKNEIPKHMPPNVNYRMGFWASSMKADDLATLGFLLNKKPGVLDVVCINIEALSSGRGPQYAEQFVKYHRTMTCVDESTTIKNPKANRTKVATKLGAKSVYRRIMSGYPITQSPLDLFSQCQFLKYGSLNFSSFFVFKNYYAVIMQMRMGTRTFPKILGYRNLEELTRSIKPFSYRKLKTECLDLPEKLYSTMYVDITPEQKQLYNDLREQAMVGFEDGTVTTTSALTTLVRLHQILCGHIKSDDGRIMDVPCNRLSVLLEAIEETDGKIIIWGNYVRDIELICAALKERYGEDSTVHYYGGTTDAEREYALHAFQDLGDKGPRFFVGTPSAGGRGLTLTAASTVVYYSNSYNLETRLQSEDRAHRIGQTRNVTYIDLVIPSTIDDKILKALKAKKNIADLVLNHFADLTELGDENGGLL